MNETIKQSPGKKKVLFLITKSNWGGAQRYVYDLATALPETDYEVSVAVGGNGELAQKLTASNINTISIPGLQRDISVRKELQATLAIAKIIRAEKPDVLHINSSKAGALGTLLGRILRVPNIVFTSHGWAFNEDRPCWQKILLKFIHYCTVLWSHKTIVVSHKLKQEMNWLGVQKKMYVVHPGRTIPTLKPKAEARGIIETKVTTSEANLSDFHTDFWIGTIAELHPIKRLHRAIDAIAAVSRNYPKIRYVIIGDGQLRTVLEQQVRDLGLTNHVFFTGNIHEAGRLLQAFDIFLLTSKSEAFGYVLLEAGLASLPCVATEVGGIPDIILHEKTGMLIPPEQTTAITESLTKLIENPNLRTTYARAHAQRAQEFSIEKMTRETMTLY